MTKKDYILIADVITDVNTPKFYESISQYESMLINRLMRAFEKDNTRRKAIKRSPVFNKL